MPYRTLNERVDGVVMTCAGITGATTPEAKLRNRQASLEKHVEAQSARLVKTRRNRP
jgi:hypothetical protein